MCYQGTWKDVNNVYLEFSEDPLGRRCSLHGQIESIDKCPARLHLHELRAWLWVKGVEVRGDSNLRSDGDTALDAETQGAPVRGTVSQQALLPPCFPPVPYQSHLSFSPAPNFYSQPLILPQLFSSFSCSLPHRSEFSSLSSNLNSIYIYSTYIQVEKKARKKKPGKTTSINYNKTQLC